MKLRNQVECEVAFKRWLSKKRTEQKKHRKSRSTSRQCDKDRLNRNCSGKFTPKSFIKTSRYSENAEQNGNLRSSKSYKESPGIIISRTSRSNSSKRKNTSSKKNYDKQSRKSRQRSKGSKNSSRRALGFESIGESSKSPDPANFVGNEYLINKYEKLMKSKKSSKYKNSTNFKSPEPENRDSIIRKSEDWKKVSLDFYPWKLYYDLVFLAQ